MTYEIGQKVMTPLGVGVVKGVRYYQEPIYQIKFMDSNFKVLDFEENELKPYKTPHERLLNMGYEYHEHKQGHRYKHKGNEDYIDIDLLRSSYYHFTFKYERHYRMSALPLGTTLELSRILTDYLEWLEAEK